MDRRRVHPSGQTIGEYAILFAMVLGAAIAMQQYIKGRLQGAMAFYANNYITSAGNGVALNTFEPNRVVTSSSGVNLGFTSAKAGNVGINSNSTTNVTK